jgi:cytidine deaminase
MDAALQRELLTRARRAAGYAYAPYSDFPVGAAALTADGSIFTG